jgi:hypothetical protein
LKTIIVNQHKEPDLYEVPISAVMGHGEYQGGYVVQFTEYQEDG